MVREAPPPALQRSRTSFLCKDNPGSGRPVEKCVSVFREASRGTLPRNLSAYHAETEKQSADKVVTLEEIITIDNQRRTTR